ncbi:protein EI24 homolog isoform X1 [Silene latifolia]|uniref:protein EI24 homolog isoform X1 n=1 Tax=Silene latifolia TaxID=37657 RepID=UPI003D76ED99
MASNNGRGIVLRRIIEKLIKGSSLWLYGLKEACSLHKPLILCYRSRDLFIRTAQCFLFNGFIFLGSASIMKSFLIPMLQSILPDDCPHMIVQQVWQCGAICQLYSTERSFLENLIYLCWFFPVYVFSFVLSTIWYNEIARHGFVAMGKYKASAPKDTGGKDAPTSASDKPGGFGGVMIGIGEQSYSLLLLSFFLLEACAAGFIPYIGQAIKFLLLCWMYGYYSFEYKWNLSEVTLDRRLDFFETNWAFFAGFGTPCALVIFSFPTLESSAVMATLFPLFVLTATGSDADHLIRSPKKQWLGAGLARVPIFCAADTLSIKVLSFLPFRQEQQEAADKAL